VSCLPPCSILYVRLVILTGNLPVDGDRQQLESVQELDKRNNTDDSTPYRHPNSQLKSLKVSPDPPQPGKELTVEVEAEVKETIDVSAVSVGLSLSCLCCAVAILEDDDGWIHSYCDAVGRD
jgi:hypothetical protein